jgi:hypothetical protein
MGIIAWLKHDYRRGLVSQLVFILENWEARKAVAAPRGCDGLDYGHPPNVRDACALVGTAHTRLTQETITNCFLKANILPAAHQDYLTRASIK